MGRTSQNPVKHVISFRVNDSEKETLEVLARELGMNLSTLMRESLFLLEEDANGVFRRLLKYRGLGKVAHRLIEACARG